MIPFPFYNRFCKVCGIIYQTPTKGSRMCYRCKNERKQGKK